MKRDIRRWVPKAVLLFTILSLAGPGLAEAGLAEPGLTEPRHGEASDGAGFAASEPGVEARKSVGDDPIVVHSGPESLLLEWRAPTLDFRHTLSPQGLNRTVVGAPGWSSTGQPGQPRLPVATTVVVLPHGSAVSLGAKEGATDSRALSHPLLTESDLELPLVDGAIVGGPLTGEALDGLVVRGRQVDGAVSFEEIGSLRGYRLGRLTFRPFSYDAGRRVVEVVGEVSVELTFSQVEGGGSSADGVALPKDDSPLLDVLRQSVVNPDQMAGFAPVVEGAGVSTLERSGQTAGSRYKVGVADEGVYELSYSALAAAGISLPSVPPAGLRMEHAGSEVSYTWDDDGDGVFDAGDSILFYARPTSSRWVDHDVYWIETGVPGTLMTTRSGDPSGVTQDGNLWATAAAESNVGENNYLSQFPSGRDGDHWYWDLLNWNYEFGTGERTGTYDVELLDPSASVGPAELTAYLQGANASQHLNPDHTVEMMLNSHALSPSAAWNGMTYVSNTVTASPSMLSSGVNSVELALPAGRASTGTDKVWLDALEIRYAVQGLTGQPARLRGETGRRKYSLGGLSGGTPVVWDVTQPEAPQVVTGVTNGGGTITLADADTGTADYFVRGQGQTETPRWIEPALELEESLEGAEYLIIAHSSFLSAVGPLVSERETEDGLDVRTVSVEAVYDTFGEGRMDPLAIRECISATYHSVSPPALDYVLLVGDGTHDPLNNKQSSYWQETTIPPYLAMVDIFSGEVPADNRFATVDGDGEGEDILPDVAIGRLPVQTVDQASTVVGKILGYEDRSLSWPWNEKLLFFADAHAFDYFHEESDEIYSNTLEIEPFSPARYYFCQEECDEPHLVEGKVAMEDATLRALNRGALLATWVGHASWHQWGGQDLFHKSDVPALDNGEMLPVVLEMTCFTSYFSLPDTDVLDEALLRQEGGGAVATWGSTGTGLTSGHVGLHKGFVNAALGKGQDPAALGPAAVAGRLALGDGTPANRSLWDTYVLFGDPAMHLNLDIVPWAHQTSLPLVFRGAQ